MKRLISLILTLTVCALTLTLFGCNGTDKTGNVTEGDSTLAETTIGKRYEESTENVTGYVMLEGMKEEVELTKYSSYLGYSIEYDKELFNKIGSADNNIFTYEKGDDTKVTMRLTVTLYEGITVNKAIDKVFEDDDDFVLGEEKVKIGKGDAYEAHMLTKEQYVGEDKVFFTDYIITDGDRAFRLETICIEEAVEGVGARLNAMIDSFEIIA